MLGRSQVLIPPFDLFYLRPGNILANAPLPTIATNSSPVSTICASMDYTIHRLNVNEEDIMYSDNFNTDVDHGNPRPANNHSFVTPASLFVSP